MSQGNAGSNRSAKTWLAAGAALVVLGSAVALRLRHPSETNAPEAVSSADLADAAALSTTTPNEEDASHYGLTDAVADLEADHDIHHAFVASGPGDVTIWKDEKSTFRTAASTVLCERCVTTDFVVTRDYVAWVEVLELDLPGFNSAVRTMSTSSLWKRGDGGMALTWGDRGCPLNNGSSIVSDGNAVYVAEGKDDASGSGYGQTVDRCDLAKKTKTTLAKLPFAVRSLAYASGELFAIWSPVVTTPEWRVQAIAVKNGAVRDVVTLPFPLPEEAASSTDLYFVYRDAFDRTSRGHIASGPIKGGAITTVYDTRPEEVLGAFAADDSGLYIVRFFGSRWTLSRFEKGAPPKDLASFDAMPRAIALRTNDVALAFLDALKTVAK